MDLLTTGVSASSKDRIKQLCDFVKKVQVDFREKVNQNGIKYGNLFDFINSKAREGQFGADTAAISESEFRECLNTLQNDEVLDLVGHSFVPTIRFRNTD